MNGHLLRILLCLGTILISIHANELTITCNDTKVSSNNAFGCNCTTLPSGKFYVTCFNAHLFAFPNIIPNETDVQILNVSQNPQIMLEKNDIDGFINLEELITHHVDLQGLEPNSLLLLKKLRILDISHTNLYINRIQIPTSVERLYFGHLKSPEVGPVPVLDLSYLPNLTELTVKDSKLTSFPKLNIKCPIKFIDLTENGLQKFQYHDLAPFCTLRDLILDETEIKYGPYCCGLKTWIDTYNISSTLACRSSCDSEVLDSSATDQYTQCEVRIGVDKSDLLFLIMQFIIAASVLAAMLFLVYRYYTAPAVILEKQLQYEEDVEEDDKLTDTV